MRRDLEASGGGQPPTLLIPEIRDYQKINAELVALLDQGHPLIRLEGAEGQRLLASGLAGSWSATIEVIGKTGPELGANLNASNLVIIAKGSTADGVGSGLVDGRILVLGDASDGAGYRQAGGILAIAGACGHRAGLRQSGGTLAILGAVGRLAGDRQSGGQLFVHSNQLGPFAGRGHVAGRLVMLDGSIDSMDSFDRESWSEVVSFASRWMPGLDLGQA